MQTESMVQQTDKKKARPHVLIIGGGFAGLSAAKHLASLAVEITIVDRKNHHTFQPLLYQVATATLSPANIAQPIRRILSQYKNIKVMLDSVVSIDMQAHQAEFRELKTVKFDYLILATGARHSYFGNDQWEKYAPGLKTIEDAVEIRSRILGAFETAENEMASTGKHKPLNFIIIGGGPTGVEMAGAISDICRISMAGDYRYIEPCKARVMLVEGLPRILGPYPEDLSAKAVIQLKELGVEVLTDTQVTDVKEGMVETKTGPIPAAVIIWAAGVQASSAGKLLGAEVDKRGCVIVNQFLNPEGHKNVFVVGDVAHFEQEGKPVPGVAPCAMQMGEYAARAIACDLTNHQRPDFHYDNKGDMATIGRRRAIANLRWPVNAKISGYLAWLAWLLIHILSLIGLRNRLAVFFEWVWTYYSRDRGVRLITNDAAPPPPAVEQVAEADQARQAELNKQGDGVKAEAEAKGAESDKPLKPGAAEGDQKIESTEKAKQDTNASQAARPEPQPVKKAEVV
jgi:NADH dehydrogenase